MAKDFSFDVVSEVETSDLINAIDQANRELQSRYDFKGVDAKIEINNERTAVTVYAPSDYQIESLIEIIRKKLSSIGIDQRVLDTTNESENNVNIKKVLPVQTGIAAPEAKRLIKLLREELPKVKAIIQGSELRVSSSKKDELQQAMTSLTKNSQTPLQFRNFK